MHIIKISSASFKIILTKEDVEKYSKKYVLNDKIDSLGFFCELKDKTDAFFDYPFDALSVNAEFFQSVDGGGELFLTAVPKIEIHNFFVKVQNSDDVYKMCRRIEEISDFSDSKLYFYENNYIIVFSFESKADELILSIMSEYGRTYECSRLFRFHLEEHAKCVFESDAVKQIVKNLGS